MINELLIDRYARIDHKPYLDQAFDFYGQGLRLAVKDQQELTKTLVFKRQEKETFQFKLQAKMLRSEVDAIKLLLGAA